LPRRLTVVSQKASARLFPLFVALIVAHSAIRYLDEDVLSPASLESFDFRAYYLAALAVREGLDLYDVSVLKALSPADSDVPPYMYPPVLAILLAPCTLLNFPAAKILWLLLNQVLLLLAVLLVIRALDEEWHWLQVAVVGALTLNLDPLRQNYELGQVNVVTLFLLAATFYSFRRQREGWAGVCLALATALKVSPALFLVYFLWKRRWRLVASALAGLAILAVFSTIVIGPESSLTYIRDTLPPLLNGTVWGVASPANQGFKGLFSRLFTENPWTQPLVANEGLAVLATVSCSVIVVVASAIACRRGDIVKDKERFDLEYSMVTLVALAVASISWDHHFVLLLLPLIVLVRRLPGLQIGLVAPAAIMAASYALAGAYAGYWRTEFHQGILILLTSPKLYAVLLLWGLLMYLHGTGRRSAEPLGNAGDGGPVKGSTVMGDN
jgi:uncharacterized membrane protein